MFIPLYYWSEGTIKFTFYGTGTRHKKVLTKNIRRVRDLEDRILGPQAMATYAFFAITFFDIIFLQFYSTKRRAKGLK